MHKLQIGGYLLHVCSESEEAVNNREQLIWALRLTSDELMSAW